ncbi:type IV pilus assembly protein PilM [candidate division WWE3 bacterium]|jgi:type IV pilus assembly protein PilM|uniref:Type IV pilus assembly protein PilM n=1 Tax=candidate division WWE3 bacterium TaxID=2053526 RepID=A0A3A4ZDU6_UNCKA|nr:MAG: type IV pilus assembly protein PilM [candidate division WWE3 bacterium]
MPIVGLDLGKNNFRAIELERKKEGLTVNRYAVYENPKLNFESESTDDREIYANSLKDFFAEVGFSTPYVVVGLDETYIYMRIIKFPQMSDKDLRNAVNYEAEQYIPLPLNEVNLSFQKLDVDYADKAKMNVQMVAARKNTLEKHVDIIKRAHLIPKAIEPETLALGRALGDTKEAPSGSVILDMGYSRSIIIITYGGFVRFTRNVQIGGDVMTRSIQQSLNLDYNQAEEYKKVYGMDKNQVDGKIYDVVKPHIDSMIEEVKRASIFFTKQQPNANIKRVILTGGAAQMPGLLLYMASNLDLEVEVANPFRDLILGPKAQQKNPSLLEQGPIFSSAYGLALKEV